MKDVFSFIGLLIFASFVAIKVGGTALAGWSWWWIFFSVVPVLSLILGKMGML